MFIKVKIDSLNASVKLMLNKVSKLTRSIKDKIKIITVKKYLLISLDSILTLENRTLFNKICFIVETSWKIYI